MNKESSSFVPFGARFSIRARIFGFTEALKGKSDFWSEVLQIHDTYGVPFDLIYQKLKTTAHLDFVFPEGVSALDFVFDGGASLLSPDEFVEFMQMTRYDSKASKLQNQFGR